MAHHGSDIPYPQAQRGTGSPQFAVESNTFLQPGLSGPSSPPASPKTIYDDRADDCRARWKGCYHQLQQLHADLNAEITGNMVEFEALQRLIGTLEHQRNTVAVMLGEAEQLLRKS